MPKPVIFGIGPEFMQRDGLGETIALWEDGQRAPTDRGFFEWWYFDAHFEGGWTAVIVFATKPIINPRPPLTPNLSLTITRPDGSKTGQVVLPPPGEFSASAESCDVHLGASWIRQHIQDGKWTYELHAGTADLSADLVFTGLVPPWRPGAGKSFFGDLDHYFAWLPSIPHGTVSGTLSCDGKMYHLRGTCYHDHNWGNVALPAVIDHWTWGRAHVGEYTLIFVEQVARRKFGSVRLPVFLLAKGGRVLTDDARFLTMQADDWCRHPGRRSYPRRVDFTWQKDGGRVHLALRQPDLIEAVSLLGVLPPVKRRLAALAVNPYYFRFNASLDLQIDLDEVRDAVQGPALYELMLLN